MLRCHQTWWWLLSSQTDRSVSHREEKADEFSPGFPLGAQMPFMSPHLHDLKGSCGSHVFCVAFPSSANFHTLHVLLGNLL